MNDSLPDSKIENHQSSSATTLPKDALAIIAILNDMGVTEYEPKVVHQLLEFTYSKYHSVAFCILASLYYCCV